MKKISMILLLLLLAPAVSFSVGSIEICRQSFFDKNDPNASRKWVCNPQTQPVTGHLVGTACYNTSPNTIYLSGTRWDGLVVYRFPIATLSHTYTWPFPGVENYIYGTEFISVTFSVPDAGRCTVWTSDAPPNL